MAEKWIIQFRSNKVNLTYLLSQWNTLYINDIITHTDTHTHSIHKHSFLDADIISPVPLKVGLGRS